MSGNRIEPRTEVENNILMACLKYIGYTSLFLWHLSARFEGKANDYAQRYQKAGPRSMLFPISETNAFIIHLDMGDNGVFSIDGVPMVERIERIAFSYFTHWNKMLGGPSKPSFVSDLNIVKQDFPFETDYQTLGLLIQRLTTDFMREHEKHGLDLRETGALAREVFPSSVFAELSDAIGDIDFDTALLKDIFFGIDIPEDIDPDVSLVTGIMSLGSYVGRFLRRNEEEEEEEEDDDEIDDDDDY